MGTLIAVGTMVIGVLAIYLKIEKQQKSLLYLQEEHLKNELKLRIYERISETMSLAASLVGRTHTNMISVLSVLRMHTEGLPLVTTIKTADLRDAHFEAYRAVNEVLRVMEQYEIALLRFRTIRLHLGRTNTEFLEKYSPLGSKLFGYLPTPTAEGDGEIPPLLGTPTGEGLTELEDLKQAYGESCSDLQAYLLDLQMEAQNELLGGLFAQTVPPRRPLDPSVEVLSRDDEILEERPSGGRLV